MKTNLEIPDALFGRAKSAAAERGIPLRELISEAPADKLNLHHTEKRPWMSALADGDPNLKSILLQAPELAIPVIVIGEYQYGISESRIRARYEKWLVEIVAPCRILRIDEATATEYAGIRYDLKRSGRPIPSNDSFRPSLRASYLSRTNPLQRGRKQRTKLRACRSQPRHHRSNGTVQDARDLPIGEIFVFPQQNDLAKFDR